MNEIAEQMHLDSANRAETERVRKIFGPRGSALRPTDPRHGVVTLQRRPRVGLFPSQGDPRDQWLRPGAAIDDGVERRQAKARRQGEWREGYPKSSLQQEQRRLGKPIDDLEAGKQVRAQEIDRALHDANELGR